MAKEVVSKQLAIERYNDIKYKEAKPPVPSIDEMRKAEYIVKGLTPEKLIIALWEDVVEGRPEEVNRIQAERVKVKEKYPKG